MWGQVRSQHVVPGYPKMPVGQPEWIRDVDTSLHVPDLLDSSPARVLESMMCTENDAHPFFNCRDYDVYLSWFEDSESP